jgi:cation:H+ antiporter
MDGVLRAIRPALLCLAVAAPAVGLRLLGTDLADPAQLAIFGVAVVAASFMLAWAAEAADLYFAYAAGTRPEYVAYAAANMTGSNRLLLGIGWAAVVLIALAVASRRSGRSVREVVLDPSYRLELGFLALASLLSIVIPVSGQIHLLLGLVLLGLFAFYLVRVAKSESEGEPELIGPAARIGDLPTAVRRSVVVIMFLTAGALILFCAEPFAHALVASGEVLGIDKFLLVQWLAPLASEAPELIVAVLFAVRGKAGPAIGMLISAKVNQWTLLIGSLPIAYLAGGGGPSLQMDARQTEEFLLTAAQTLLGIAALLSLRFSHWLAWILLGLFAVQFAVPSTEGRLVLTAIYAVLAIGALIMNRQQIVPTLLAPFRRESTIIAKDAERELAPHR